MAGTARSSFGITLGDGRNVDICTEQGALDYVAYSPQFVSRGLGQLPDLDDAQAGFTLLSIGMVADSLSPQQLRTRVDASQKESLAAHAATVFADMAARREWRKKRTPRKAWSELWESILPWCKCPAFVHAFVEGGGAAGLAAAAAAIAPPPRAFAEHVVEIARNCCISLRERGDDLEGLGRAGLAAAVVRCAPTAGDATALKVLRDDFLPSGRLVRKHFKPGAPAEAAARDAEPRASPAVRRALAELRALGAAAAGGEGATAARLCRRCSLDERGAGRRFKSCARCGDAYYCSRECQRLDWKAHKPNCNRSHGGRAEAAERAPRPYDAKTTQNVVLGHVQTHYFEIRRGVMGLLATPRCATLADVVVLFDQRDPAAGTSVRPWAEYADGSAIEAIGHWFHPGTDVFERNVASFMAQLRQVRDTLQPDQLFIVAALHTGTAVQRLTMTVPGPDGRMFNAFSAEALDDESDVGMHLMMEAAKQKLRNFGWDG